MNENKTLVEKIRVLVFGEEEIEVAFLDVKTSEGIVLRVSEIKEGETVVIISEDGEIPTDALEYILEDGTKITVDEAGVITTIEAVESDEETPTDTPVDEEMSENDKAVAKQLGDIKEALSAVLDKFAEVDGRIEGFAALPVDDKELDAGKTVVVKHSKEDSATKLAKFIHNSRK